MFFVAALFSNGGNGAGVLKTPTTVVLSSILVLPLTCRFDPVIPRPLLGNLQMIYLMQDAVSPETQRILNLNVKRGVKSVYEFLEERGGLGVLGDPAVEIATREVLANGRPRPQITKDIRRKVRDANLERGKLHGLVLFL